MNDFILLAVGACLALLGGAGNDEFRAWREGRRELNAMKIALCDELGEISDTIKNMHEVWEKSKILYPSYVADVVANTAAFDGLRQRLFLLKDAALRKRIVAFYKSIKDVSKKSEGKLGSLAETPEAIAEQTGFD